LGAYSNAFIHIKLRIKDEENEKIRHER